MKVGHLSYYSWFGHTPVAFHLSFLILSIRYSIWCAQILVTRGPGYFGCLILRIRCSLPGHVEATPCGEPHWSWRWGIHDWNSSVLLAVVWPSSGWPAPLLTNSDHVVWMISVLCHSHFFPEDWMFMACRDFTHLTHISICHILAENKKKFVSWRCLCARVKSIKPLGKEIQACHLHVPKHESLTHSTNVHQSTHPSNPAPMARIQDGSLVSWLSMLYVSYYWTYNTHTLFYFSYGCMGFHNI